VTSSIVVNKEHIKLQKWKGTWIIQSLIARGKTEETVDVDKVKENNTRQRPSTDGLRIH